MKIGTEGGTGAGSEHQRLVEGWKRWKTSGEIPAVLPIEVRKACVGLAVGRAPGPDGLPAEVFRKLRVLTELIARLFSGGSAIWTFPNKNAGSFSNPFG